MGPYTGKNKTVNWEAQTLDLPEKDFKMTIINIFKEQRETMSKI